jgi:uridine phosphorylase
VSETIHLRATAPLAPRVLLPGDPGRALLLAQSLLREPKMFNHNRGLWGYSGEAADGRPLTIQSTGMGGPSAAIVISELHELGARTLVRVGTCGALVPSLALGELIVVSEAIADDGASRALGASGRVAGDAGLRSALELATGGRAAPVVSTDLFYDVAPELEHAWVGAGAVAAEMETATLFALAARNGNRAAALLIVSDVIGPPRRRLDADGLVAAERALGDAAVRALRES